ncbi:Uncharacterised protein [Burkholderia pseudomallei]|nr:Uncharacterised protein [Burkholderia pseudomallei]CAJ3695640.1 Uncharacterised protein [Burkholderia pseudomallei]CAJ4397937.1 Uncharacterised protein [Burkholderia pseudomallei]CAJ4473640.1 Uncharacterised protein [Burkholderia pseudomallei]CAJ4536826.1 Uncharacterised protein [Burkholderia pseudomallei]
MMSRETIINAIEAHEAARCKFVLEYPGPCGNVSAQLTAEDIADAILSMINLPARASGLTPEEYAEWVELNGRVRCTGLTARKAQCRNTVSSPQYTNPFEWRKMRDTQPYCSAHGGA